MNDLMPLSTAKGVPEKGPRLIWYYDHDGNAGKIGAVNWPKASIQIVRSGSDASKIKGYRIESVGSIEEAKEKKAEYVRHHDLTLSRKPTMQQRIDRYQSIYHRRPMDKYINTTHYVYQLLDDAGDVIYVGCTRDVERRVSQHKNGYFGDAFTDYTFETFSTRKPAFKREGELIFELQPEHNNDIQKNSKWRKQPQQEAA